MFNEFQQSLAGVADTAAMSRVARMVVVPRGAEQPEFANVQLVSGQYFHTLGISPAVGRLLNDDDNKTIGAHPVAVISDKFWRGRFYGSPDIVGQQLSLNGALFTIVGVAQPDFSGVWLEIPTDIWIPVFMQSEVRYAQAYSANQADTQKPWISQNTIWWLDIIVRPRNVATTTAVLGGTFSRLISPAAQNIIDPVQRERFLQQRIELRPFAQGLSALRLTFISPLKTLMAMVALLLLVACANTANLLLARASSRQREIAVRLSLGATRGRLIRQLLLEGLLVGAVASIAGLLLTPFASDLLIRRTIAVVNTPAAAPFSATLDGRVLIFTIGLSLTTTVLFALIPALRATRVSPIASLKSGGRGMPTGSRLSTGRLFVVSQVAFSLVLVVGAALSITTLSNLVRTDLGFDREHLLSVGLRIGITQQGVPRLGNYRPEDLPGLSRKIIDRIEAVPGVRSASVAVCGLVSGCISNDDSASVAGYDKKPGERILIQTNFVGPNYLSTVGMRLVAGREFDGRDLASGQKVAVVNESMASRYFANHSAVGGLIGFPNPDFEIIGVVADARVNAVRQSANPMVYFPLPSNTIPRDLVIRTSSDPAQMTDEIRRTLQRLDPNLVIERVITMSDQITSTLNTDRLIASLSSTFGVIALGLASFGLYGLMTYTVTRRNAELGVRIALGAARGAVLRMILKESLILVAGGIVAGLAMVFLVRHLLSAIVFGIDVQDPSTLLLATITLIFVGVLSACIPAWRASRIDPLIALRYE
jgi:predicted permease